MFSACFARQLSILHFTRGDSFRSPDFTGRSTGVSSGEPYSDKRQGDDFDGRRVSKALRNFDGFSTYDVGREWLTDVVVVVSRSSMLSFLIRELREL